MEYLEYQRLIQAKFEKIVLIAYTIYNMGMTFMAVESNWPSWYILVFNLGLCISWIVYAGHYKTYRFRTLLTACMIQASVVMYLIRVPNLLSSLSIFIALVILLGLYGAPEIIYTTGVSATVVIFYHIFFLKVMQDASMMENLRLLLQIGSLYFVEYMVYYLVKKQMDGSEQLLETIMELQEAERSKDDFLSNVSHEIRTPVNTICGVSEILLRDEPSETSKDGIFEIQNAGKSLMSVVSDILDFSELQADKVGLIEETYNITSTLNDIINMTISKISEKNIELIVDCHADIPSGLVGDEQKIRRVIMNLVNNAIKYTENGCVALHVDFRRTAYGGNLSVIVRDTGIGMRQESVEKLFTSFSQVDTRRNRQEGGLGLGLAISEAIVSKMGGFITVHSELGKGSEFQFVIPQKIKIEEPIISIREKEKIKIATYVNMEQYELAQIRDEYTDNIMHLYRQLGIQGHLCHNLAELKRRAEREHYNYIFISLAEYQEDTAYFDELSQGRNLVLVIDRKDEEMIRNPRLQILYKPFYVLSIARILNGEQAVLVSGENLSHRDKFISPDTHILVVDDNIMNIKVLEGLLKPYQIKVTAATSGQEALDRIDAKEYDLIFMDHMMPEMDGIETMHRIRRKHGNYYENVPVIAFTANAVAGTREMFMEEGFQDFIAKPVEASVLERVLRRNIPEQKILPLDQKMQEAEGMREETQETFGLQLGDLDVERGIAYCGSMENYLEVLKMHCIEGEENRRKINGFFEAGDWKNYTILIHALKSSMQSIGAISLSKLAKGLEQAGKEEDADYILENHEAMMKEYEEVLQMLRKNKRLDPDGGVEEEEDEDELPVIDDEEFDRLAQEFEDAVYTLKGENVREALHKMQRYSYRGQSLKKLLEPLEEQVEMNDFMSAYDEILSLRERMGE